MKGKGPGISAFVRVYSIILMLYTGWRTLDFMMSQLPKNDLSFWLSIVFLFAAEAGLLLWSELAMKYCTTDTQEYIAKTMAVIDFIGSTAAGTADMIMHQTLLQDMVVPRTLGQFLIYGMPIIMAANVGAVFLYLWFDADQWIEREKRQTVFEITKAAIQELKGERVAIAGAKKGLVYSSMKGEVLHLIDSQYGDNRNSQDETGGFMALPSAKNGTAKMNQEVHRQLPPAAAAALPAVPMGNNHQDPTHPG
jgi:hypothetical protein